MLPIVGVKWIGAPEGVNEVGGGGGLYQYVQMTALHW